MSAQLRIQVQAVLAQFSSTALDVLSPAAAQGAAAATLTGTCSSGKSSKPLFLTSQTTHTTLPAGTQGQAQRYQQDTQQLAAAPAGKVIILA